MEGTTFNSVSVGFTKTEAYNNIPLDIREKLTAADAAEVAVANRIGEVHDVADVVGMLVGEKARVSVSRTLRKCLVLINAYSGSVEALWTLLGKAKII